MALTAVALLSGACESGDNSNNNPPETNISTANLPQPTCKVNANVLGKRKVDFTLETKNWAQADYSIEGANYDFGDGSKEESSNLNRPHTYTDLGTFTVNVAVRITVNPGGNAPFKSDLVPCQSTTVTVRD